MNNRLSLLFIIIFLVSANNTKAGWEKLFDTGMSTTGRFISFDNAIIVASDSGIYRSTDSGKSWIFSVIDKIKRPDNTEISITATMFCKNDKFIFASTNSGVYASGDSGKTWKSLGPSPDGKHLWMMSVFAKGSYIFTTMAGGGVFRSSDNGVSWSYLGAHRFYKYIDHQDKLFAAAMDGLWFSADLGQTWHLCPQFDIYPRYISVFSITHNGKYIFADCWDKFYRTDDGGLTIQSIGSGLPFSDHNLCGIYSAGSMVFAGFTNKKIYFSKDDGEHWSDMSEGLDTLDIVNCFDIYGKNLLISKNKCLWSSDLSLLTDVKAGQNTVQLKYELSQNYPNPFNPFTMIRYTLPEQSLVEVKIYNIMGNEVRSFTLNSQSAGYHTLLWDGRNMNNEKVSSGTYIYRLRAISSDERVVFEKSAKMSLIK